MKQITNKKLITNKVATCVLVVSMKQETHMLRSNYVCFVSAEQEISIIIPSSRDKNAKKHRNSQFITAKLAYLTDIPIRMSHISLKKHLNTSSEVI